MDKLKFAAVILSFILSSECFAQYNYGIEVENQDARIEGSLDLFDPNRSNNVYIGRDAGVSHSFGNGTIIIGSSAGSDLIDGSRNVFLGSNAGRNVINAFDNVIIGSDAGFGFENSALQTNIRIGGGQITQLNVNNSIAIGHGVGSGLFGVEQSDRLTIEPDLSLTGQALLFGEFDTDRLGINWQVKTSSGQDNPLPATLSINGTLHISETAKLEPLSSEPSTCTTSNEYGLMYYDNSNAQHTLRLCTNSGWIDLN